MKDRESEKGGRKRNERRSETIRRKEESTKRGRSRNEEEKKGRMSIRRGNQLKERGK